VTSLPPIDSSVLPADVRAGSPADQQRYKTALAFERELVSQLTQQMADTAKGGESQDGGSAAQTAYRQQLPGVLADSIMSAGGLGLARTVAQAMKESGQ
jgi:Rod binding domain-containing protein